MRCSASIISGSSRSKAGREAALREAEGQVGGADVDAVEAGGGGDRLEVRHRLGGLDHGEGQDLAVGLGRVVGAGGEVGAGRAEAALAERRVAQVADEARPPARRC